MFWNGDIDLPLYVSTGTASQYLISERQKDAHFDCL